LDYDNSSSSPSYSYRPSGYQPFYSQHLVSLCRLTFVKESLIVLVERALSLISDLNTWFADSTSSLDPVDIQNFSCVLECQLLSWLQSNEGLILPLEDALCVALLIFAVCTTAALASQSYPFHPLASKRLRKALSATSRNEWQAAPDLLLWILAVGAISAEGSQDYEWFIYQTSLACDEFGIGSAAAFLRRLHDCGWVGLRLDKAVEWLWGKIEKIRLEGHCFIPIKSFAYT